MKGYIFLYVLLILLSVIGNVYCEKKLDKLTEYPQIVNESPVFDDITYGKYDELSFAFVITAILGFAAGLLFVIVYKFGFITNAKLFVIISILSIPLLTLVVLHIPILRHFFERPFH